jgi:hypothetical protein
MFKNIEELISSQPNYAYIFMNMNISHWYDKLPDMYQKPVFGYILYNNHIKLDYYEHNLVSIVQMKYSLR